MSIVLRDSVVQALRRNKVWKERLRKAQTNEQIEKVIEDFCKVMNYKIVDVDRS